MKKKRKIKRLLCTIPLILSTSSSHILPVMAEENEETEEKVIEGDVLDKEENPILEDASGKKEVEEHEEREDENNENITDEEISEEIIVEGSYDTSNEIEDGIYQITASANSNYILDVEDDKSADGTNVYIYWNTNSNFTRWKVKHDSEGYVTFINMATNKALDVNGGISDNGTNIQLWTNNGSNAQKWKIVSNGDGSYRIVSKMNASKVLDIDNGDMLNGQNVQLWDWNGTKAQRWDFKKIPCPSHKYTESKKWDEENLIGIRTEIVRYPYEESDGYYKSEVVCNGCSKVFETTSDFSKHAKEEMMKGNGKCGGYHVEQTWIETGRIYHDAIVKYYRISEIYHYSLYKCEYCGNSYTKMDAELKEVETDHNPMKSMSIASEFVLKIGESIRLVPEFEPSYPSDRNDISYTLSNSFVESNGNGVFKAKEIGDCYVTISSPSGITIKTIIHVVFGTDISGWFNYDENWYYINEDGTLYKGWLNIDDYWYFMDDHGVMQTGWIDIGKNRYYFDKEGQMFTGVHTIGGKKYYFDENGHLIEIKKIELDRNELELKLDETYKLEATIEPSDISEIQAVIWTTSDASVVSVDEDGNLKAEGSGTAVITAETITGLKDSCSVTILAPQQKLMGYSIVAGGDIGLNYHFEMDDESIQQNPYILFSVDGRTQKSVPVKSEDGSYIFTVNLNYKEMNVPVSAIMICGSRTKLLASYSIQNYVNYINKNSEDYEEKYVNIANAMLNCGYRIQDYFGYQMERERLELNIKELDVPDDYEILIEEPFVGSRLVLKSKIGLKLYFRNDSDFTVNGIPKESEQEGGLNVITIDDISPVKIGDIYKVEGDEASVEFGVLNYCYLAQQSDNEELAKLGKALYTFYRMCN